MLYWDMPYAIHNSVQNETDQVCFSHSHPSTPLSLGNSFIYFILWKCFKENPHGLWMSATGIKQCAEVANQKIINSTTLLELNHQAMTDKHKHNDDKKLQPILVFGPPLVFPTFEAQNLQNYHFLKAYSSQLPLHQFLAKQNVDPSSIQVILCNPHQKLSVDVIPLLPSLSLIVTTSAGTDHIDLTECSHRNIQVVSIAGEHAEDIADMTVGLLIDVIWKISATNRHVRKWGPSIPLNFSFGYKLEGKRVGIVGLGKIGVEVGKRLEAFGCKIMYNGRSQKPLVTYPFYSNVLELASNSDILVISCSLNEQTRHMVNREVMLALGKEGIIVNVGRGALIDEKELVRCLMEGKIGGAGLDVYENEPNIPKELIQLDNVVLSPHAASLTSNRLNSVCERVTERLEAFFSSKLPNILVLDD
ncbi:hypothetical protein VNO78_25370 [Psophocarpus tetragonolobus]|uniref:glyoxylate reductase (NADP(+)) n=1 Tax=Psophocarpus tetragonolobus TaxID=3891 RepID=A0AAN9S7N6_PSOTE